jgi:hypothetical protein
MRQRGEAMATLVTTFQVDPERRVAIFRQGDGTYRALDERVTTHGRWRSAVRGWCHDTADADEARDAAHWRATKLRAALAAPPRPLSHNPGAQQTGGTLITSRVSERDPLGKRNGDGTMGHRLRKDRFRDD